MFSLTVLIKTIVVLIVVGLIFWLLWWLIQKTNPPEPFKKIAEVILMVFAVLVAISVLLNLIGIQVIRLDL